MGGLDWAHSKHCWNHLPHLLKVLTIKSTGEPCSVSCRYLHVNGLLLPIVESLEDIWDESLRDNQLSGYSTGFGFLLVSVEDTLM